MGPFPVAVGEIPGQQPAGDRGILTSPQENLLVLDRAPQALNPGIVQASGRGRSC